MDMIASGDSDQKKGALQFIAIMRYCFCIEKVNKFENNEIEFVFLATGTRV